MRRRAAVSVESDKTSLQKTLAVVAIVTLKCTGKSKSLPGALCVHSPQHEGLELSLGQPCVKMAIEIQPTVYVTIFSSQPQVQVFAHPRCISALKLNGHGFDLLESQIKD